MKLVELIQFMVLKDLSKTYGYAMLLMLYSENIQK